MSLNLNEVTLAGNLTRDPELRYTPKGMAVCKFGVAINRKWRSESGEQKEEVTFVDVDGFGRNAENVAQYLKKGRGIFIKGRLKLDQWDDKQTGQKRSKLGVVMESFQFTDSKQESSGDDAPPARRAPSAPADGQKAPEDDSDVPF